MWESIISSAAGSAGSSLLGGLLGPFNIAEYGSERLIDAIYNQHMMEEQNEINIENWNRENEYNLPTNQYQRYVDAGMSPAAAMQAITGVESNTSPVGLGNSMGSPTTLAGAMTSFGNNMLNGALADSLIRFRDSQSDYFNTMSNRYKDLTPYEIRKMEAETNELKASELEKLSKVGCNDAQKEFFEAQTDKIRLMTESELELLTKQIETQVALTSKYNSDVRYNDAAANELEHRSSLDDAMAREADASAGLKSAEDKGQQLQNIRDGWRTLFIEQFHADPDAEPGKQLIQQLIQGDTGATTALLGVAAYGKGALGILSKFALKFIGK